MTLLAQRSYIIKLSPRISCILSVYLCVRLLHYAQKLPDAEIHGGKGRRYKEKENR
jgi:hypothetical protein